MIFDCDKTKEKLSEYIDDMLDNSETELIKEHIASCKSCAEEYNRLRLLVNELNMLPEIPLPSDFKEKLHNRLVAEEKPLRHINISVNWRRYSVLAAGLLIAVIIRAGYLSNDNQIKTAYVDDAVLQTAPDNGSSEAKNKESSPFPTADNNYTAFQAPAQKQKPQKMAEPDVKSNNTEQQVNTQNDVITKESITAYDSPQIEAEQIQAKEELPKEQNETPELIMAMKSADSAISKQEDLKDSAGGEASAKRAPTPLPSQSPTPSSDVSLSTAMAPSKSYGFAGPQNYVSVTVKVDNFDKVFALLKEKYNAALANGSITLELDTEKYNEVMDLLDGYGAEVTVQDVTSPLTSNICVITKKD